MIRVLETSEFSEEVQEGVVVVDFFATWCPPCKMLAPVFEEVSTELTKAKFVKVDIDQSMKIAQKHSITSVPTVMVFKNGEPVERLVGFTPKENLKSKIAAHI